MQFPVFHQSMSYIAEKRAYIVLFYPIPISICKVVNWYRNNKYKFYNSFYWFDMQYFTFYITHIKYATMFYSIYIDNANFESSAFEQEKALFYYEWMEFCCAFATIVSGELKKCHSYSYAYWVFIKLWTKIKDVA